MSDLPHSVQTKTSIHLFDILSWVSSHQLELNMVKTQLLILPASQISTPLFLRIVNNINMLSILHACNPAFILDLNLPLGLHII